MMDGKDREFLEIKGKEMRDRRGKEEGARGEAAVPCLGGTGSHRSCHSPSTARMSWGAGEGESSWLELGHPGLGGSQQLAQDTPMLSGWPARAEISKRTEITPLSRGRRWRLLLKVFSAVACNQHFE